MVRAMAPTLLETARSLAPLLEQEAAGAEAAGAMSPAVVQALTEAGLFGLLTPACFGGAEADIVTALEVLAEVCRAEASAGWSLLANVTGTGFAGAYTGDAAAKEMFTGTLPAIHAGQYAPRGSAEAVDGGFRVAGSYSFASGSDHAGFISGGALEVKGGEFVADARGGPMIRAFYVPRDRAEFRGNWDVLGLRATHSIDYEIPAQVVDAEWTFPLLEAEVHRGGPVYHLGVLSITAMGHAAFALGTGARAVEEAVATAGKQRMGGTPLRDQQLFQHDLAMQDAAVRAARAYVLEVFGEAQAAVDAGATPSAELANRLRQATTYATRIAGEAVTFAYTWAGSDALRNGSSLGRLFRDVHASTQHIFVDNNTLTGFSQVVLGGGS